MVAPGAYVRRVQPKLTAKLEDGKAAHDFKSSFTAGASRWLKAYILNKWGADPKDNEYSRLARKVHRDMKLYIDEAKSGDVLQKPGRHVTPGGHSRRGVPPTERTRIASITRQVNNTQLPELQHELFQWWVDLSQHLHARVPTAAIVAEAKVMLKAAVEAGVVNLARMYTFLFLTY